MPKVLNLKKESKKFKIGKKEIIVVLFAIIITSVGIKATDTLVNNSGSGKETEQCPSDMVFITSATGGFCMDKFEASAGNNCTKLNPTNEMDTYNNLDDPDCQPVSQEGKLPWRNISQNQAALMCARAGKRLPANKEWLQAALGTPDLQADWNREDCNVADNWSNNPGQTGSGAKCVSSFGVFDMVGNVWEWVDGTISDGVFEGQTLPDQGYVAGVDGQAMPSEIAPEGDKNYNKDYFWIKKNDIRAIARGGYWSNKSDAGQYSVYMVYKPSVINEAIGFRCAK